VVDDGRAHGFALFRVAGRGRRVTCDV
jgi:hypothetical protein